MKYYRIFWLGCWLAGGVTPAGWGAALAPEKLYQMVLPSVLTLEVETQAGEKFVGSAVLALADDVALTAWHVVADARVVWAVFADGQRVRVLGVVDHASQPDVALLKLEQRMAGRQAVLEREVALVAARVYVVGTPKGYDFSITDGLISQTRIVDGGLQYQLSCPISPGNSGSPIFNQHGKVIGIASWTKSDAQNVNFAIPTQEFTRLQTSKQLQTWAQLAAGPAPAARPANFTKSRQALDLAIKDPEAAEAESFAAFQKRLNDSVGKSVTIVVQEADQTNSFTFTVR